MRSGSGRARESGRKVSSGMKVKRSSAPRSGGGGGFWKRLLANPITPVLIGLAIVLSVGVWVLNDDPPASGEKTGQTDKAGSGTSGAGSSTGTGSTGTGSTGAGSNGTGSNGTGSNGTGGTVTGDTSAADKAIVSARSKIDRTGGAAKSMLVTVYYSDGLKNGLSLQPVEIKVPYSVATIKTTAEQIANPPQDLKLFSNVPAGTKVLSVNLKSGVAIVDLSTEVTGVRGSAAVNNIVASFVYSLTTLTDVKAVQLWVNGRPALLDGFDWTNPLSRADLEGRNLFKIESVVKYAGS